MAEPPRHSTNSKLVKREISVHGNPIDPERRCIDTATFEQLGQVDDPRDVKQRFPNGERATNACVRRVSDGRVFSSSVPLTALPPGRFETCPDSEPFHHCSCEFSECGARDQPHFAVACSAEDYCWSQRTTAQSAPAEGAGHQNTACDEAAPPSNQRCSYTPEGDCACDGDSTPGVLPRENRSIVATQ